MKKFINRSWLRISATLLSSFFSVLTFAQDKGIDVDINVKKEQAWYQNPVVWVIGGAVFILLLVALLRGGAKKSLIALRWIYRKPGFYPAFIFSIKTWMLKWGVFTTEIFNDFILNHSYSYLVWTLSFYI